MINISELHGILYIDRLIEDQHRVMLVPTPKLFDMDINGYKLYKLYLYVYWEQNYLDRNIDLDLNREILLFVNTLYG